MACAGALIAALAAAVVAAGPPARVVIPTRVTLDHKTVGDQDDLCLWIHPADRSLSTIITSDKVARRLFVYDLAGTVLQIVSVSGWPGNIDVRYGVPLGDRRVDLVAYNDRERRAIGVLRVDPSARRLVRLEGRLGTHDSYGLCLYRSPQTGRLYAFTTAEDGAVEQYELKPLGRRLDAVRVRSFHLEGRTEACVCDDEAGRAYFAEERAGIREAGAEPADTTAARLVARVGDASGLTADVEGLAIYHAARGGGYLIASSQGSSELKVYDRRAPHALLETVSIRGVTNTDGIDVTNVGLGPRFPQGLLAAHNDAPKRKTVELCGFEDLRLARDTSSWDPRVSARGR